jgi:copper resistance protein B
LNQRVRDALLLALMWAALPAMAQQVDHSAHTGAGAQADTTAHDEHAGHGGDASHDGDAGQQTQAPPAPTDHAADALYDPAVMAAARQALYAENAMRTGALALQLAELRLNGDTSWRVQGRGWYGDENRAVLRLDAVVDDKDRLDDARIEALYSHAIAPYWNLVAGLRADPQPSPSRGFVALGIEGLAPYRIAVEATAYLSNHAEAQARIEAHTAWQLTQRFALEPRVTMDLLLDEMPEQRMGRGIANLELGLRLRWEHWRRFAPYAGVEWQGSFGDTARYVAARGDDPRTLRFVVGVSAWL